MPTISFPTSNFIGRAMQYRGPHDWKPNEETTQNWISPDRFLEIIQNVVTAGFDAVDIWSAHCHWKTHDREDFLEQIKGLCSQFDLTITSYTGAFEVKTARDIEAPFRFMKQLGAPLFAGQISSPLSPGELGPILNQACKRYGAKYAFLNESEKSIEEILAKTDNGQHDRVGIALDTGACAAQGIDALEATQKFHQAGKLFSLCLSDIKEPARHETCALGEGIVPCADILKYLVHSKWHGNIAVEHAPFDRDPMPEIEESIAAVKKWISAAS